MKTFGPIENNNNIVLYVNLRRLKLYIVSCNFFNESECNTESKNKKAFQNLKRNNNFLTIV